MKGRAKYPNLIKNLVVLADVKLYSFKLQFIGFVIFSDVDCRG